MGRNAAAQEPIHLHGGPCEHQEDEQVCVTFVQDLQGVLAARKQVCAIHGPDMHQLFPDSPIPLMTSAGTSSSAINTQKTEASTRIARVAI
jgi:hypothetical protein